MSGILQCRYNLFLLVELLGFFKRTLEEYSLIWYLPSAACLFVICELRNLFEFISTHDASVAVKAALSRDIDVIMIQVNLANNAMPGMSEMMTTCVMENTGLVAMKPFAGGKLLHRNRTVYIAGYQKGGKGIKKKIPPLITAVQCLNYALSQPAVSTVVPGVKNVEELGATLEFLDSNDSEKDFSHILLDFKEYVAGDCVYCNHCQPCPAGIDIGNTIRMLDTGQLMGAENGMNKGIAIMPAECNECGSCIERCPFGVDIIAKMNEWKEDVSK